MTGLLDDLDDDEAAGLFFALAGMTSLALALSGHPFLALPASLAVLAGAGRAMYSSGAGGGHGSSSSDVATLQERYVDGDLDEAALERELALALDPTADRIRQRVEEVNGVGPAISRRLALEFATLDALRRADVDRLTDVHDVGPSTAAAIVDALADPRGDRTRAVAVE